MITQTPTARSIGTRIQVARDAKSWNQEQLAAALEFNDRQIISQIELGIRQVKPAELVKISELLDRDIEFFIDPFVVAGEASFSWRAADSLDQGELDAYEDRAGQWVGLLRWLRLRQSQSPRPLSYKLNLHIRSQFEEAIALGEAMAHELDLGSIPAERLIERVESELDVPVLFVDRVSSPDSGDVSGATCHLPDLGVILINRHEPVARRNFDLAHELFHVLTWDAMKPDHRESNNPTDRGKKKRIEQLADNFAAGLLMPRACLDQIIDSRRINDVDHLSEVAAQLRVSAPALAWRLFNLTLINDDLRRGLCAVTQETSASTTPKRFSYAFLELLHAAIAAGHLSSRKAAKTLGFNLPELADLFSEHGKPTPFAI